jgi:hypothetical protein
MVSCPFFTNFKITGAVDKGYFVNLKIVGSNPTLPEGKVAKWFKASEKVFYRSFALLL